MTIDTGHIFEVMGTAGSMIMCAGSVPQIWKAYRTKCTDGLIGLWFRYRKKNQKMLELERGEM